MRTIDDFACLKEAGFKKIYSRIDNAITHYNDDDVPTYCAKFRLALDLVVSAVRSISQIDKSLLHGTTGTKIGTFKLLLPEPLYKDYGWQLLTDLNEVTKHYHHEDEDSEDEESDYPPREQWNTDAEKCYELMRKISDWLIFFKREMTDYVAHNKPDYKQILKDKKAAYREEAASNTIANSEKPEFFEKCTITLDMEKQYREGLMSDLVAVENDIIIANQENYDSLIDILDSSSLYKETEPFLFIREVREQLIKLLASRQVYTYFSVLHPIVFRETWSPDEIADAPFSGANLSMEDIHYGLKHINGYASANIIRKLSCHDLTKKRFIEVLYDKSAGAVKAFYGVVKELSPEDIKVLDNIGNFRRYVYNRDKRLIYTAKEQALAIEDKNAPAFFSVVSRIADDFKVAIMEIASELFAATIKEDWHSFEDFEKKYVENVLQDPELQPYFEELQEHERQKRESPIYALTNNQYLSSAEEFKLKRKQYKEDLKQYISNTLSEYSDSIPDLETINSEFPVIDERLREVFDPSVFLPGLLSLLPILKVCVFILKNRTLVFVKGNDINESIKFDRVLSASEVFDALKRLTPMAAISVLGKLKCDSEHIERLQQSFTNSDREQFESAFTSTSCDKSFIYFICSAFPLESQTTMKELFLNDDYLEDMASDYDYYVSLAKEYDVDEGQQLLLRYYDAMNQLMERIAAIKKTSTPEDDETVNGFIKDFTDMIGRLIPVYKYLISYVMEDGFLFEKEMLSSMISQLPVDDFIHNYERFEPSSQTNSELPCNDELSITQYCYELPPDLFEGKVDTNHAFIPGLKNELKNLEAFEPLFSFILRIGGINCDEEAGTLLRAFTGYPVNNAYQKAKWETDYHILYYLVKYMFTPKKSYVSMSQCIDIYYPSDDEKRKAEKSPSSYAERISGDDAPYIIETLSRLSSVFPRPETPIAD